MARAKAAEEPESQEPSGDLSAFQSVVLLTVPAPFYKNLQDEALRRGMTAATLLRRALDKYLKETEPKE